MKILTLGHSLAVDSGHMLNLVAAAEGFEGQLDVATLYHSGCPLSRHAANLEGDIVDYNLYLSSTATADQPPVIQKGVTMRQALVHDNWDVIIMQGANREFITDDGFTNGNLQKIKDYVNLHKTNPNAVFGWHMHWIGPTDLELLTRYEIQTGKPEENNGHKNFYKKFNFDRQAAYEAVVTTTERFIPADESFRYLIPTATTVQNAVSSYLGERGYYRDYAHAGDLGRLIVAYTWYCVLTGKKALTQVKVDAIPVAFLRSTEDKTAPRPVTEKEKLVLMESVNNALANPFRMTPSRYTE